MNSSSDSKVKALYKIVGPLIVERKQDWKSFYQNTIVPLTVLIKKQEYTRASKLYKYSTLQLVDQYATNYSDENIVNEIYQAMVGKQSRVPYMMKYIAVKAFLKYKILKGAFVEYVNGKKL